MAIRKAYKAGSWYRADAAGLTAQIEQCLERGIQWYGLGSNNAGGQPVAAVVPHAGLDYSGPMASLAYCLLRERIKRVDCLVVFGACHRAFLSKPAIWSSGVWQTPLGDILIDSELAAAMIDQGVGVPDETVHADDNSIELQTPFIKYLFPEAKMVPVAISPTADAWRRGELASVAAAASGKTIVAIASSDLTHYGHAFGCAPAGVGQPALEWIEKNDRRFLDTLVAMELERIVPVAERDGSACGAGAAAAAAGWAKTRGCRNGRLLAHANSHLIAPRGEAEHVVGYASLVYELPVS